MSGHRQAALAMHGVGARDQELILAELPQQDRQLLRTYLNELRELGFDPAELAPGASAAASPKGLHGAAPDTMAEVLGREPASLIAAVLRIDHWPWAVDFMERLSPAKAQLVRAALHDAPAGVPARDRFLLEALAGALARHQPPAAAALPDRRSWLRKRMSAWMR